MGREIRRVPKGWKHPKDKQGDFIPLYDADFETRAKKWLDECKTWEDGTHPDLVNNPELKKEYPYYWDWDGNPPDRDSYRPKFESEPTCYQMYETVSEGTPVSPVFETPEELIGYLVEHGDYWDQKRGRGGMRRESVEAFVKRGWSPSFVYTPATGIVGGIEALGMMEKKS